MFKRWLLWCVCTAVLIVGAVPCYAQSVSTSATAAVLLDADTGEVLYKKNSDRQMLIASTTKIMTALVALERSSLQDTIVVRQEHMVEGSSMYLAPGEEVTVEELLYGLLLCSGNDAALVLADACCGSVEVFVEQMNAKAQELGLIGTSFANPNGLDHEKHYSTAEDMAKLAAYAVNDPVFVRICSTIQVTIGGRTMSNHNRLLHEVDGCIGLKTGYTKAAGRTLVSCVQRDGCTLVAVTLQDGNDWADHKALYDFGFTTITQQKAGGTP